MQVVNYSVADLPHGEFEIVVMGVLSCEEDAISYALSILPPGAFTERASLAIGLEDDLGREVEGWLLPDVPDDVMELVKANGIRVTDWQENITIHFEVKELVYDAA